MKLLEVRKNLLIGRMMSLLVTEAAPKSDLNKNWVEQK